MYSWMVDTGQWIGYKSVFYLKSNAMNSVQVGKAVFVKVILPWVSSTEPTPIWGDLDVSTDSVVYVGETK